MSTYRYLPFHCDYTNIIAAYGQQLITYLAQNQSSMFIELANENILVNRTHLHMQLATYIF